MNAVVKIQEFLRTMAAKQKVDERAAEIVGILRWPPKTGPVAKLHMTEKKHLESGWL
jgi:hypothetical protein